MRKRKRVELAKTTSNRSRLATPKIDRVRGIQQISGHRVWVTTKSRIAERLGLQSGNTRQLSAGSRALASAHQLTIIVLLKEVGAAIFYPDGHAKRVLPHNNRPSAFGRMKQELSLERFRSELADMSATDGSLEQAVRETLQYIQPPHKNIINKEIL